MTGPRVVRTASIETVGGAETIATMAAQCARHDSGVEWFE